MRPGVKTDLVLAEVDRQIKEMRDKPVDASELQKAKNLEEAQFVYGQDSIFRDAMLLGIYQMLGDYHLIDQYIPEIEKVTVQDVQRVAQKYLVDTNRTVAILEPTGMLPKQAGGSPSGGTIRRSPAILDGGAI